MPRRVKVIEEPRFGKPSARALIVTLVLVAWMLAIGARLVQVQITQHDDLAARAQSQQLGAIERRATSRRLPDWTRLS